MTRRTFYELAKGLEMLRREEKGAFGATDCGWKRRQSWRSEGGYDYFTTTLSISPLKNAQKINEIGEELAEFIKCHI